MEKELMEARIKKGMVIIVTSGSFDGYSITGLYRVRQDVNVYDLAKQYQEGRITPFEDYEFARWLVSKADIFEEIKHHELHIGEMPRPPWNPYIWLCPEVEQDENYT